MLARRLLGAARGGGTFSPPPVLRVVVFLTRLSNYEIANDTAFPFDTARVVDTNYCTWAGEGNPVVIVRAGWYWVGVNATTLGTFYGAADNQNWYLVVRRNATDLLFERHHTVSGASADLMSGDSAAYLDAGDEIVVWFHNSGDTDILVESNPSDGLPSGYLTDDGPGTIGTHLYLLAMSGGAPE